MDIRIKICDYVIFKIILVPFSEIILKWKYKLLNEVELSNRNVDQ